jgi:hypothetical protein
VHHEEVLTGSQEIMVASDEENQNTGNDESNGDGESVASGESGLKKAKKRKEGGDNGSVRKKMKIIVGTMEMD